MHGKSLLLNAIFLLISLSAWATQPLGVRLMDVNDSNELKTIFNSEKGKVRIIAILSPT